jgi:hypothetical protein
MPTNTYVLSDAFASSGIQGGVVVYGPRGQAFDVLAALVAGGGNSRGVGGSFAVSDPDIISALVEFSGVKVVGTTSTPDSSPVDVDVRAYLPSGSQAGPFRIRLQNALPGQAIGVDGNPVSTGSGILNLSANPTASDGVEGQWAFNSTTGYLFGPKAGTNWGNGYPLNGEEISLGGGLPGETIMENYASLLQNGGRSMSGGRCFSMRHRPKRTRVTTKARFIVSTAASADDTVEIAVFAAVIGGARIAYVGPTTGKLNATGVKEVAIPMTWDPSADYYAVLRCGTLGGTAASLAGRTFQSAFDATIYGSTPPLLLCGYNDGTMPTTTPATLQTSLLGFPLLWFVE